MYFSQKLAIKLITSVAPFVEIISSLNFALIYDFTISLVSSNLFVAFTARVWTLLPTFENSVS